MVFYRALSESFWNSSASQRTLSTLLLSLTWFSYRRHLVYRISSSDLLVPWYGLSHSSNCKSYFITNGVWYFCCRHWCLKNVIVTVGLAKSKRTGGRGAEHKNEPRDKGIRIRSALYKRLAGLGNVENDMDDIVSMLYDYWARGHKEK